MFVKVCAVTYIVQSTVSQSQVLVFPTIYGGSFQLLVCCANFNQLIAFVLYSCGITFISQQDDNFLTQLQALERQSHVLVEVVSRRFCLTKNHTYTGIIGSIRMS